MTSKSLVPRLLLTMLAGSKFANIVRMNGRPCRIQLPSAQNELDTLIRAHISGKPATLTFVAGGYRNWKEEVDAVALFAFCPRVDHRCGWMGIDLDAADHGLSGLVDPKLAAKQIAESAHASGLGGGLLVASSRGGRGRHVFIVFENPVTLEDAVIGLAALVADAFKTATQHAAEENCPHTFQCISGEMPRPGDAGSLELIPRSTTKPQFGWSLALPAAGRFARQGGGIILDPFADQPIQINRIPRCDSDAWAKHLMLARWKLRNSESHNSRKKRNQWTSVRPLDRISAQTKAFLDGRTREGARNRSAFAASANLLGCSVDAKVAEELIVSGALACGLPEREARAAFESAKRAVEQRRVAP